MICYLSVDKNETENLFIKQKPVRDIDSEHWVSKGDYIILPKGSIEKIIGRNLNWNDNPITISILLPNFSENKLKQYPTCKTCNSFEKGWCTNFGKEVESDDVCKFYKSTILE